MFTRNVFLRYCSAVLLTISVLGGQLSAAASPGANGRNGKQRAASKAQLLRPLPPPRLSLLDQTLQQSLAGMDVSSAAADSSTEGEDSERGEWKIMPFIGTHQIADPTVPPDRPAISAVDPLTTPPSQIVAGFTYSRDNRFFLNFGYGLPTAPLREYVQPFGLELTEEESKRISIGIDISF